jgi:predicted nucleotidyltransferase
VLYGEIYARRDHVCYGDHNCIAITADVRYSYTVEEFQSFTKMRASLPPWANIARTLIPLSCCDAAASHLIKALGGKEVTTRTVGGTKWWQVRGIQGYLSLLLTSTILYIYISIVIGLQQNG